MMKFLQKLRAGRTKGSLKSFREDQASEEAFDARDKGYKDVPLERIVGSVGRYHDFDGQFRPLTEHHSDRLQSIRQAMREGKVLPPVSLYQIRDEYYIMDGNHRVAAAKSLGWPTIRARILEFLPSRNTLENMVYREKTDFMEKTGLAEPVELTEVGQYAWLLKQIEDHRKFLESFNREETGFEKAAADWYESIFRPFIGIIQRSHLLEAFPRRTQADLFAYISFYQWEKGRERRYGIGLDDIIPKSMEEFRTSMGQCQGCAFPEMRRMITAIVLINVKVGEEYRVMDRIFALDEVKEIYDVPGEFDLIVKIVIERDWLSSDSEVIGYFVYNKIRKLDGVVKTQTLVPTTVKHK